MRSPRIGSAIAFWLLPAVMAAGCTDGSEDGPNPAPLVAEVGVIPIDDTDGGESAQDTPSIARLTAPGCCTGIFWAPDSRRVLYIDRPSESEPVGIYAVDAEAPDAPPSLFTEEIAYYSDDFEYRFDLTANDTSIVRISDGERWSVPSGGRPVSISPAGERIAWQVAPDVPPERRTTTAWVANLDGTEARAVATLPRGAFRGWLNDDALLVSGRDELRSEEDVLWRLDVESGERRELARAERMRGEVPSIGGDWVIYYISRQDDPENTGTWIVPGEGGDARKLDPELFGAYRWRDAHRLIVVPLNAGGPSHALLEVDARTLETRALTDPAVMPFKIANGEWTVSPDGRRVAFVESADKAVYVIELGVAGE